MIGFLSGRPLVQADLLLVVVNGVGYEVKVGPHLLEKMHLAETVDLHIVTYVREDKLELFGFANQEDKQLFQILIAVSGVGPKTGLQILDRGSQALTRAVQQAEVGFFTAVPRVGKKLGQKIIIELKSKLGSLQELSLGPQSAQEQEIFEALKQLGFADTDIDQVLPKLQIDEHSQLPAVIKQALRLLK